MVYVLVDPRWKSVECLQLHVENIFHLENLQFITEDGCYIPPKESVEVIKTNDILRAINQLETNVKRSKKKKQNEEVGDDISNLKKIKKRKLNSVDCPFMSSTPHNANPAKKIKSTIVSSTVLNTDTYCKNNKKKECSSSESEIEFQTVKELSVIWDSKNVSESSTSSKVTSTKRNSKAKQYSVQNEATQVNNASLVNTKGASEEKTKPQRKRCRKRKHKSDLSTAAKTEDTKQNNKPITQNKQICLKSFVGKDLKSAHTYFDENGSAIFISDPRVSQSKTKTRLLFKCRLEQVQSEYGLKPRIFEINRLCKSFVDLSKSPIRENHLIPPANPFKNKFSKPKVPKVKILEDIVLKKASGNSSVANDSSVIEVESFSEETERSDIIDLNGTEENSTVNKTNALEILSQTESSCEDISLAKILPLSEPLTELPSQGDIIIFKIYRLNGECNPTISDYITGKCEAVDSYDGSIKCSIINGFTEVETIPTKFSCVPDDECSANDLKHLTLKLKDMLEAKIFKMS